MDKNQARIILENERDNAKEGEMLEVFDVAVKALAPRNLVIECSGGIVQDVHGLPTGWTYEIADWDEQEDIQNIIDGKDDVINDKLEAMIRKAKEQA